MNTHTHARKTLTVLSNNSSDYILGNSAVFTTEHHLSQLLHWGRESRLVEEPSRFIDMIVVLKTEGRLSEPAMQETRNKYFC